MKRSKVSSVKNSFGDNETSETDSVSADESYFASTAQEEESSENDTPNDAGAYISLQGDSVQKQKEAEDLRNYITSFFVVSLVVVAGGLFVLLYQERRLIIEMPSSTSSTTSRKEEIAIKGQSDATICFALILAGIVMAQYGLFRKYDQILQIRQRQLWKMTERSQALVTSLFPEDVHRRLMVEVEETPTEEETTTTTTMTSTSKMVTQTVPSSPSSNNLMDISTRATQMHAFLEEGGGEHRSREQQQPQLQQRSTKKSNKNAKPIADFFPEATIMFGDLVGFTAWSSMREPTAVFTLLEAIYFQFDQIARQLGVFKVETIGDCYVAVCGLPLTCAEHALVMARFAYMCRAKLNELVKELEKSLGPDTADLAMRIGLHSGPVTAGVLRGDRARFQLFGDSINTTSRIESTGKPNKIHMSTETAEYLFAAGKKHWLVQREDKVPAKGKGELTTYWLLRTNDEKWEETSDKLSTLSDRRMSSSMGTRLSDKHLRLVDWIAMELANFLKEIEMTRVTRSDGNMTRLDDTLQVVEEQSLSGRSFPRDEIQETIILPNFQDGNCIHSREQIDEYELDDMVLSELHEYVLSIAQAYLNNPFHNFEHASHVTMSVVKLLSRIVPREEKEVDIETDLKMHQQTYGIASDPLAQFAVVLAALVHDVDHPGVPNIQLVKEKDPMASDYKNRSPAEQNSINLAWRLLMEDRFANFRSSIYSTEADFHRFRNFLVNTVMSTDIMDKDLSMDRKKRWDKAFSALSDGLSTDPVNLKATIVLEHLIQASDVAHTMQHWHIYRKWNGRLFEELYKAYTEGRAEQDPSEGWYEMELGFFDKYIIPLAKKLKDCGVFGVSSDEYLNYAEMNRKEWALNGKGVISGIVETLRLKQRDLESSSGPSNTTVNYLVSPLPVILAEPAGKRLKALKKQLRRTSMSMQPSMVELPQAMSVLVVDDDKILRKMFTRSVKQIAPEWKIQEAGSGEEALQIVSEAASELDLIFMDHYMGSDDSKLLGSETVAELRNKGVKSKICGMSANDVEQMFDDSGADGFVFKPLRFRKEAMRSELERILGTNDEWGNVVLPMSDITSFADPL